MKLSYQFMRFTKGKTASTPLCCGLADEIVKIPFKYFTKKIAACLCTSSLVHDSGFNSIPSLVLYCFSQCFALLLMPLAFI